MPYDIVFAGIVNFFDEEKGGRRALIPDGTKKRPEPPGFEKIDPHYAGFYVETDRVLDYSNWWPRIDDETLEANGVRVFRIEEPSLVVISGLSTDPVFDQSEFENAAILLRDVACEIDIDPKDAMTIAQIPIHRGTLVSRTLGTALVAQLTVETHTGPITITALPNDGGRPKTLVLKGEGELSSLGEPFDRVAMVIANMSEAVTADPDGPEEENHFRLYGLLDKTRRTDLLVDEESVARRVNAPPVATSHPYLSHLDGSGHVPHAQCSVTGCCNSTQCESWQRRTS